MAKSLTWIFKLFDQMSGPSRSIEKGLGGVERALKQVNASAKESGSAGSAGLGAVEGAAGGLALKLNAVLGIAQMVVGTFVSIGGAAIRLGVAGAKYALDAVAFKEQTSIALRTFLGSQQAADATISMITRLAARTPFETRQMQEFGQALLFGGVKAPDLHTYLQAVGDIEALKKGGGTALIDTLTRINNQGGRVDQRELRALTAYGISEAKVYQNLASIFRTTVPHAMKAAGEGMFKAQDVNFAILKTIQDTLSGGKLGNVMNQLADTVPGLLSTIASRPFEMLMDLDKGPGVSALKGFLSNIATLLDPASEAGGRLKEKLEGIFNGIFTEVFGSLSGAEGLEKLEAIFDRMFDVVSAVEDAFKAVWPYFKAFGTGFFDGLATGVELFAKLVSYFANQQNDGIQATTWALEKLGQVLGYVVDAIGAALVVAGAVGSLFLPIIEGIHNTLNFLYDLGTKAWDIGKSLVEGFKNGILDNLDAILGPVGMIGLQAAQILSHKLEIHSPSRVFYRLGAQTTAGFEEGVDDGSSGVRSSLNSMVTTPAATASTVGRVSPHATVNITVNVDGGDADVAEEIAARLKGIVLSELAGAFEGLAIETGSL